MRPRGAPRAVRIEWLFVLAMGAAIAFALWHLRTVGYLPQPFYADPKDSWMDGYNSAWWAYEGHIYDDWASIYPPLNFIFLRLLTVARCYDSDPLLLRDCDQLLIGVLTGFFFLNVVIAWKCFRMADARTALPRALAVGFGLPALMSLERGQLLIVATTFFFLGFGPLLRSARGRMLAAAIAINFKPYFVIPTLLQLLAGRWRWVEGAGVLACLIWLAAFAILGEGSPLDVIQNIAAFSGDPSHDANWRIASMSSSYASISDWLRSDSTLVQRMDDDWTLAWAAFFDIARRAVQILSVTTFAAIWLRRYPISRTRMALLAYGLLIMTSETGAYAFNGLIFLVFLERWDGPARVFAIVCAYFLCLPIDLAVAPGVFPSGRWEVSFLGGRPVLFTNPLALGPFIRPGLILAIQVAMAVKVLDEMRRTRHAEPGLKAMAHQG